MDPTGPRNPLIIPVEESKKKGCPKCGGTDFNGRKVQGSITFTCSSCKNQWAGGLPQEPQDPRLPTPPEDPASSPSLTFMKGRGDMPVEVRRGVSLTQEFRKGSPVPKPGEEDV